MYFTPWCGYCRAAKRLLERKEGPYLGIDVSGDNEKRQWLLVETGQRTVPQIFINGESIGGFDELNGLDRAGALDGMLAMPPPADSKPPIP